MYQQKKHLNLIIISIVILTLNTVSVFSSELELPKTMVGEHVEQLMKLFQSGDREKAEEYISANYSDSFLKAHPMERHIGGITITHDMTPDLKLKHIVSSSEYELNMILQSSNSRWLKMRLLVDDKAPHKILQLGFEPTGAPVINEDNKDVGIKNLTSAEKKGIVENIIELMKENYVFPDIAEKAGRFIYNELNTGNYKKNETIKSLSLQLTDDLRKITKDKHIKVIEKNASSNRNRHFHPIKYDILPDNIGYIDLRSFEHPSESKDMIGNAMKEIENTDAIIFDMRNNGGGSPEGVQYLCSYLFDKKVHLNSLYWRKGDRTDEFWTLDKVNGKKRPDVPVFVLTSHFTFSGAEEFTYNLQTQKRATIIGEITGGGANPGEMFDVNSKLGIFIPKGKAINPITKTNWEGVGVKPDIEVRQEDALETALEQVKIATVE